MVFEESFENVEDVQDILVDTFDDFMYSTSSATGRPGLQADENGSHLDTLPDFTKLEFECKCVDCDKDKICGGIWKGRLSPGEESHENIDSLKIHVVVAHCSDDINWISNYTNGFTMESLHIISRCGNYLSGVPEMASTVDVQPDLVGIDHSHAYYITKVLPLKIGSEDESNSIVVFLRDDMIAGQIRKNQYGNDFEGLVKAASSNRGFGYGIIPNRVDFGQHSFDLSAYHGEHVMVKLHFSIICRAQILQHSYQLLQRFG